jgi:uncharacterized glyoxalase superfamily protein PhnB
MTDATTPSVWVTLKAHDAPGLIGFLEGVFGLVLTVRHDDGDRVAHAELVWPEGAGGVMLGSLSPDGGWPQQPGGAGAYVVVADAERARALHARAVDFGADVFRPLAVTDYGSTDFAVRDPEGNLWSFGTYPGTGIGAGAGVAG